MSDERDPRLQTLFAEAEETLDDKNFTSSVMKQIRNRKLLWISFAAFVLVLALTFASQFMQPLQSVALVFTQILSIELINLGDSQVNWILTPINNLATLLVVLGKLLRMTWKKVHRSSFAN